MENETDPNGNHVAIDFMGSLNNIGNGLYALITNAPMNNGQIWYAWVDYDGSTSNLQVRLSLTNSRPAIPTLVAWVNLIDYLGTTNAYVGFTGATGGAWSQQDILSWQINPEYHPVGVGPLSVFFTSPTNGQMFLLSPTNILLAASVSNSSGTVTGVGFFNGTTALGLGTTDTNNIYSLLCTNVAAGTYSLSVFATNSLGSVGSNTVSITVNAMPTVSITSPTNLQEFAEVTNVTLTASASDADGTITNVAFYSGTNFIGNDATSPYSIVWNSRTNNYYPIVAVATDNRGVSSASSLRVFKVIPNPTNPLPQVTITWPSNNSVFAAGSDITITAETNGIGTVTNVEFYVDGESVGTDADFPYSVGRCCWTSGQHTIQAKVTDYLGRMNFSLSVTNTILPTFLDGEGFWDPQFGIGMTNAFINSEGYSSGQIASFAQIPNRYLFAYEPFTGDTKLSADTTNWSSSTLPQPNGYADNWYAIVPDGTNVYFVGAFGQTSYYLNDGTYIGNTNVLRWDGSAINPIGNGLNREQPPGCSGYGQVEVRVMAKIGGDFYIGGNFTSAGPSGDPDTSVQYIAKLDAINNRWVPVGNGFPVQNVCGAGINAIAAIDNEIYIGGCFTNAGGNSNANYIARLAGNCWTNVGAGIEIPDEWQYGGVVPYNAGGSPINAFAVCGTNLFVGGRFQTIGGLTNANGIAVWDTVKWHTMNGGAGQRPNSEEGVVQINSISVHGDRIFVGGNFTNVLNGSEQISSRCVASALWSENGQRWIWSALDAGVESSYSDRTVAGSLVVPGELPSQYDIYFWGNFQTVGEAGILSPGLARWRIGYPQPANVPKVTITAPVSGVVLTDPTSITLSAVATSTTNIRSAYILTNGVEVGTLIYSSYETNNFYLTNLWEAPSPGVYLIKATAKDDEGLIGQSTPLVITVKSFSNPITALNDQYSISEGTTSVWLPVLTNDTPTGSLKISQVTTVRNDLGRASIGHDGTYLFYTPMPNVFGTDIFYYTVTNSSGNVDSAAVTVKILAPPQVQIAAPYDYQRFRTSSAPISVTGTLKDWDGNVTNVMLFTNGVLYKTITNVASGFATNWMDAKAGFYSLRAVAQDNDGLSSTSAPVTVILTNATANTMPVAQITNLVATSSSQYSIETTDLPVIRDGLFDLLGQAFDPDAGDSVSYSVQLFRPDDWESIGDLAGIVQYVDPFADVTPGPLNPLGFHTGGDNAGALGQLDLTQVPDGVCDLVLRVRGGSDETNAIVRVKIESQLKIGQFSFSEQDLVLPVSGIPLTVTRTYNSLNSESGAFGYSWTYALNDMDVKLDDERTTVTIGGNNAPFADDGSSDNGLPKTVSIRTGGGWDVTLTLPDGRRVTFPFKPRFANSSGKAYAEWESPAGVTAKLTADPASDEIYFFPSAHWEDSDLTYGEAPINNHDIKGWTLETQDGTKYYITRGDANSVVYQDPANPGHYVSAEAYGEPKLTKIVERTGDSIVINDNSISHYNATNALTRTVLFERDGAGRITALRDPNSGSNGLPSVKYVYNRDTGNLIWVQRLIDRAAGTYTTTKYHYDHPKFPHYITSIEDPRGIPLARNEYDDSGKLIAVVDANGKRTEFHHDINGRTEAVIDRLGNTNTYVYDLKGNVTAITNALGQVTLMAYNDPFNASLKTAETNAFGTAAQSWTLFRYDENGNQTNVVDSLNHTNAIAYDSFGNLLKHIDPLGNSTTNGYDANGNLTVSAVLDASGNVLQKSVSVYQDGKLKESRDANNQLMASFSYDSMGNLTATADANNFTRSFGYDANGNQTNSWYVWVDGGGTSHYVTNRTEYDAAGRVTQSIDANGNTNQTFYTVNGKVDYTIDRFGNTNSFFYDARGNLVQATYPDGLFTRTVYNDDGKAYVTTDRNGVTGTRMEYDALGRVTNSVRLANVQVGLVAVGNDLFTTTLTAGGTILSTNVTVYDVAGRVKSRITTDGTTSYDYYPDGQLKSVTDAMTNTTTYEYDPAGRQKQVVDALNRTNRFEYDGVGRAIKTIFADNSFTTNIFNELGQKVGEKDQANLLTQFTYNTSGQLTNVTKPTVWDPASSSSKSPAWSYKYDSYGRLTVTSDPLSHSTTNVYDALGREVARWLPMGQNETNIYNSTGQLWKRIDFKGQALEFRYDQYGRVTNKYYFVVGQTQYPSNSVSYIYNNLGQLTNITERSGTDASNGYASLLPPGGNMLANAGWGSRVREMVRAAVPYSPPLVAFVLFCSILALVPGGREVCRLLAAYYLRGGWKSVLNRRDAEAQRVSLRRLRLPSLFWRFATVFTLICLISSDPSIDRMWSARAACTFQSNDSTSTTRITTFHYDYDGRLDEVNTPEGAIHYGYDLATGRLTSTCTKYSEVEYGYDALGRLKTVHVIRRNNATVNETTTYTYTKVGSRETVTLPNGTVTTWQYDTLNRLTNLTHRASNNALLASYSYQLHPTGRRTNATEIVLNTDDNSYVTNTTTWWHDGMYRLTNEVTSSTSPTASMSHSTAYEYDLAGNRTKRVQGSETVTYQYNANDQLTNEVSSVSGATTHLHDANGSLTNKTVGSTITSYTYNLANKLASVALNGTVQGSYQYNDQGIRVRKTEGSTTYYLVDANNHTGYQQVLEESTSIGGAPSISYVLGDDVLGQCGSTTSDPGWFLYDGHGSTRQLVHSTVNVTSQFHYDAYGQSLTTLGTPETTMLYSGEQYDTTLGMYNLRARYYDPSNGRFNQRDTFVGNNFDPQSLHKYAYCLSDPINGLDPSGRFTLTELMVVTGIISLLAALTTPALMKAKRNAERRVFHASGASGLEYARARDPNSVKLEGVIDDAQQTANDMALYYGELDRQADFARGQNTILAVNTIQTIYTANDVVGFAMGGVRHVAIAAKTLETTEFLAGDIKVIGRTWDTEVAREWPGHDVLQMLGSNEGPHVPDGFIWSLESNDRWVAEGISKGQVFYCASPEAGNMIQTSGRYAGQPTVLAREIAQLKAAGYAKVGDYYVPASKAATFKP